MWLFKKEKGPAKFSGGTDATYDDMFVHIRKGTFCAFDRGGQLILSKRFMANLAKSGISRDWSLAACHTLGSDNEEWSLLTLFDLSERRIMSQWRPESGPAREYDFDRATRRLFLVYAGRAYEEYPDPRWANSFDGEFLDRDKWIKDMLA